MSYLRDLWQEIKQEYLKQVQEVLKTKGRDDIQELLDRLDSVLEQKYADLTLEEKSVERFEKIIAQMGPATQCAEILEKGGLKPGKEPVRKKLKAAAEDAPETAAEKRTIQPVIIPVEPYDDATVVSKAKWLVIGVLAASVIAILVWQSESKKPESPETVVQTPIIQAPVIQPQTAAANKEAEKPEAKANVLEFQSYIVRFTTASDVNAISAADLLAMFTGKETSQIRAHHFKTEIKNNKLIGLICVDNKKDLDAASAMLLSSNNLKLVSVEPGTEENLRQLYAMGQPSLEPKPAVSVSPEAAAANTASIVPIKNAAQEINPNGANIIVFKLKQPRQISSRQMLDLFNADLPRGITTHHYRTEVMDGELIGFICADGGISAVTQALSNSTELVLVRVEPLTQESFDKILSMRQQSNGVNDEFLVPIKSWRQNGRIVDQTEYPFVLDSDAVGHWTSVDYVQNIGEFNPSQKTFGGRLVLIGIVLNKNGSTSGAYRWTKGIIIHPGDKTASRYVIKQFDGTKYMFLEWKSGDYIFRHQKPRFYVLKNTD